MDARNGKMLCICCQKSLKRNGRFCRKSFPLNTDFIEKNPFVTKYIAEVSQKQITCTEKICKLCFQRSQRKNKARELKKQPNYYASNVDAEEIEKQYPKKQEEQVLCPNEENEEDYDIEDDTEEGPDEDHEVQGNIVQSIELPGQLIAAADSNVCIFAACNNRTLRRIKVNDRMRILKDISLYIPEETRICTDHMCGAWQDIIMSNVRQTDNKFSSKQISDMLNLLKKAVLTRTLFEID